MWASASPFSCVRKKTRAFYASHIGKEAVVLMEKSKAGKPMHGFTDNYVRVELPYDLALDNQLVRVRMGDFNEDGTALMGTLLCHSEQSEESR